MINLYKIYRISHLNDNVVKKSILYGIIISSITIISYLLIVIFTSPNLPVIASIYAVLQVNSPIIIGLAIGTGIQGFVISYRKKVINNKCEIKTNKKKKLSTFFKYRKWMWSSIKFLFLIFLFGSIRMLWQLAFHTLLFAIGFWKRSISIYDKVFKYFIIYGTNNNICNSADIHFKIV